MVNLKKLQLVYSFMLLR